MGKRDLEKFVHVFRLSFLIFQGFKIEGNRPPLVNEKADEMDMSLGYFWLMAYSSRLHRSL